MKSYLIFCLNVFTFMFLVLGFCLVVIGFAMGLFYYLGPPIAAAVLFLIFFFGACYLTWSAGR